MHDCPCCGEAVYSDDSADLCSCCIEAGCEAIDNADSDLDGVYADCQIPTCAVCDTRLTFDTSGEWSRNCDDSEECDSAYRG